MTEQKVFIKSNNNVKKINLRYMYSLIIFIVLSTIINYFLGYKELIVSLLKSLIISFITTYIISYIINITSKKYRLKELYADDSLLSISLIIGLFGINTDIIILIIAILLALIIRRLYNEINLSSSIYAIILIILYK